MRGTSCISGRGVGLCKMGFSGLLTFNTFWCVGLWVSWQCFRGVSVKILTSAFCVIISCGNALSAGIVFVTSAFCVIISCGNALPVGIVFVLLHVVVRRFSFLLRLLLGGTVRLGPSLVSLGLLFYIALQSGIPRCIVGRGSMCLVVPHTHIGDLLHYKIFLHT